MRARLVLFCSCPWFCCLLPLREQSERYNCQFRVSLFFLKTFSFSAPCWSFWKQGTHSRSTLCPHSHRTHADSRAQTSPDLHQRGSLQVKPRCVPSSPADGDLHCFQLRRNTQPLELHIIFGYELRLAYAVCFVFGGVEGGGGYFLTAV